MRAPATLYLVVPCYNEEEVLPLTAPGFLGKIRSLTASGEISADSRVLFVDDGSRDRTYRIIEELAEGDPLCAGVSLSRNRGHQNALLAGLHEAAARGCDVSVTIDCDGQDDIDALDRMLALYREGCDVVYGVRDDRRTDSAFKRGTAAAFYKFMRLMGVETVPNHADYRLLSRRAMDALSEFKEVNLFLRGLVPLVGFKSGRVYYPRRSREAGSTHYPLRKMLRLAADGITSLSVRPIRIITATGLAVAVLSFAGVLWAVISYLRGVTVAGWASVICVVCFFGGLQLLATGTIGEYIGKIYLETKARPRYIIAKRTGEPGGSGEQGGSGGSGEQGERGEPGGFTNPGSSGEPGGSSGFSNSGERDRFGDTSKPGGSEEKENPGGSGGQDERGGSSGFGRSDGSGKRGNSGNHAGSEEQGNPGSPGGQGEPGERGGFTNPGRQDEPGSLSEPGERGFSERGGSEKQENSGGSGECQGEQDNPNGSGGTCNFYSCDNPGERSGPGGIGRSGGQGSLGEQSEASSAGGQGERGSSSGFGRSGGSGKRGDSGNHAGSEEQGNSGSPGGQGGPEGFGGSGGQGERGGLGGSGNSGERSETGRSGGQDERGGSSGFGRSGGSDERGGSGNHAGSEEQENPGGSGERQRELRDFGSTGG